VVFSCPACAFFVLGVVGKGSPSSPEKKFGCDTLNGYKVTPKVLERIMYNQIVSHLHKYILLSAHQSGF